MAATGLLFVDLFYIEIYFAFLMRVEFYSKKLTNKESLSPNFLIYRKNLSAFRISFQYSIGGLMPTIGLVYIHQNRRVNTGLKYLQSLLGVQ